MAYVIPNVIEDIAHSAYQTVSEFISELQDPNEGFDFSFHGADALMNNEEFDAWLRELEIS